MKFFLWFFALLVLILGAIVGIYYLRKGTPEAMARLERGLQAQFIQPTPHPTPPPTPTPTPGPAEFRAAVQEAALLSGVEVESFEDFRTHQIVVVRWRGSNLERDKGFIEALRRLGRLQSSQADGTVLSTQNQRGETVHSSRHRLVMM